MSPPAVFFLHNPKAGGASLRALFANLFDAKAIAPVFSNAPNDHRENAASIAKQGGYSFYAGHYGYDVYRQLRDGHAMVTNFRDPVERIVSVYRYWRNNISPEDVANADPRDAAIVMLAHQLDFSSFIRSANPDLQLYISNFHFRQLLNSPWECSPIRPWDRFRVKRRISRMAWFYVTELPHVSALLLRSAFVELASAEIPSDKRSRGDRIDISRSDVEHLVSLNGLDYDIYYHAVRLQHARFKRLRAQG